MPKKKYQKIPTEVEQTVVQLLAMGFERPETKDIVKAKYDYELSNYSTWEIAHRNADVIKQLAPIKRKVKKVGPVSLLSQLHNLMGRRLALYAKSIERVEAVEIMYDAGRISYADYMKQVNEHKPPSLNELVSAAREMHAQSAPKVPASARADKLTTPDILDDETAAKLWEIHRLTIQKGDDRLTLEREVPSPDNQASESS